MSIITDFFVVMVEVMVIQMVLVVTVTAATEAAILGDTVGVEVVTAAVEETECQAWAQICRKSTGVRIHI